MSTQIELDPVTRITTGAVGEPGGRTFYLQARKDDVVVSLLMEKQQVALLTMHIDQLLERVGAPSQEMEPLDLEEPIESTFRIGRIGLGYDEDRQLVLVQCEEFVPEEDEMGEDFVARDDEPGRVRLWATREQMQALARRGEQEVAAGRPICPMCGDPMDPEGHFCPRSNGHREIDRLR
jgi:uncharacterized repeat protein (TIGR03847 family)